MKLRIAVVAALSVACIACAGPSPNAFEEGRTAYLRSDYETAFKEFKIAAESGHTMAQVYLADMYYQGQGTPQDLVLAYAWFELARDVDPASVRGREATIAMLELRMSPEQVARGIDELAELKRRQASPDPRDGGIPRTVSPEEMELVVDVAALENSDGRFLRLVRDWQISESAHWPNRGPEVTTASVFLDMVRLGGPSTLVFVREPSLPGEIYRLVPNARVSREAVGRMSNRIGELEYQRFELDRGRECVFFRQFVDTFADQRGMTIDLQEPAGNIYLRGWFCEASGTGLSDDSIRRFVEGLGIKGIALPAGRSR